MKTRKLISLLLAAAMVLSLLAACGGEASAVPEEASVAAEPSVEEAPPAEEAPAPEP